MKPPTQPEMYQFRYSYAASSLIPSRWRISARPLPQPRKPSLSGWYLTSMPRARTAVTAGDHIDWITTSPEAIRLTDWSKVLQSARQWPARFSSISLSIVWSISSLVMLPLSP